MEILEELRAAIAAWEQEVFLDLMQSRDVLERCREATARSNKVVAETRAWLKESGFERA
jgi:hypothetical protein